MTFWKRPFDLILAVLLGLLFLPGIAMIAGWMALRRDLPVFYVSERMKSPDQPFPLVKLRTMRNPRPGEPNGGVSGGDKSHRITPLGRFLRRFRLDEVPQLWNVLRGDMSFVGPRPPLRRYTEMFPEIYRKVLKARPGITGLASIIFHRHEAWLLEQARTPEETESIYINRCIPRKARLDTMYVVKRSIWLDIYIMYLTAAKIIPLPGRRARRMRRH